MRGFTWFLKGKHTARSCCRFLSRVDAAHTLTASWSCPILPLNIIQGGRHAIACRRCCYGLYSLFVPGMKTSY